MLCFFTRSEYSHPVYSDTVTDFSWEPRGERFAVVLSSDPNLGNAGPGVTVKTDVSFYQLERGRGDFKLLSAYLIFSVYSCAIFLDSEINLLSFSITFPPSSDCGLVPNSLCHHTTRI